MVRHIIAACVFLGYLGAQSIIEFTIPVDTITWTIQNDNGYERIDVASGLRFGAPGDPELPVCTYTYLLPYGSRAIDVTVTSASWALCAESIHLFPRQIDYPVWVTGSERAIVKPEYGGMISYPHDPVVSYACGNMRGFSCLQVSIVPFCYYPQTGKLMRLQEIVISCSLGEYEPLVSPMRQTSQSLATTTCMVGSALSERSCIFDPRYRPPCLIDDRCEPQEINAMPSYDGAPIDLLIVTDDIQYDAYLEYARMTGLWDFNTTVRTLSWIRQRYEGLDDAECIRAFLRDAVKNWGVLYVLLGGDTPVIPSRWVFMEPLFDRWPVHIVSDLYYADLDGTWNADGDSRFGEVSDSLDFYPDVIIGRLPTRTPYQVNDYRDKITAYVTTTAGNAPMRALFITSDFEVTNDAYQMAQRLAQHLPSYFDTVFLNERPRQEVLDSLNRGFGFIMGLGHGDNNSFRIRNNPRENLYNYIFDSLMNTACYGVMPVITCYTNTIQTDCLGEHWILNRCGGGCVYIGPTCSSEAYLHEEFTAELLDSMFRMPIGAAHSSSKVRFISQAHWDNWYRLYEFSITMLGDPTLWMWDSVPLTWSIVNVTKDTVQCGQDSITLYCAPPVPFSVVFTKDGEVFHRDSSAGVVLKTQFNTKTPGYVRFAIHADGFQPYIDSLYVEPREPRLYIDHCVVIDSLGNNNGVMNPGETLVVYVYVKNSGAGAASGVNGTLWCNDRLLKVISDHSSYPKINSNAVCKNSTPFILFCSDSALDAHAFDVGLRLDYMTEDSDRMRTVCDHMDMACASSILQHYRQTIDTVVAIDSIMVTITTESRNVGHECAQNVCARIRSLSDSIVIIDSTVVFPVIPPNAVVGSGGDVFTLWVTDTSATITYEYALYENDDVVSTMVIVIDTLGIPGNVRTCPQEHAIRITWQPVDRAEGYRILRSAGSDTGYVCISDDLVSACTYDDRSVSLNTYYHYRIIAVDQFMNHGEPSAACSGTLAPPLAAGWPQPVFDYLFSSCTVAELDPFYPGYEIVVCGKEGRVYAWHYDGSPVGDDAVIFDISTTQVWTSPAVGDLDNDGVIEIVFGVRRSIDNLYVISAQGQCPGNWPITVPGQFIGSPVLADLDANGDLEIVVWTLQADVYVFDHDGNGFFTPTGLLKDLPGIAFGSPSVGDIDQDGMLEIVCAGGSGGDSLYVWDHQGTPMNPFPVYIQSQGMPYSTVLANICGDDRLEVLFYADETERVYAVDADGSVLWSMILGGVADIEGSPVIGDVTGDGYPEIICGYQTGFTIFDSLGTVLNGYPDTTHDAKLPVVGDVDEDGFCEAVVGSVDWNLYAYMPDNAQVPGFPMFFNNRIESSPGLFDIDNDGLLELMVGGDGLMFHVFDLSTTESEWPLFRYDQYNSGTYQSGNLTKLNEHTAYDAARRQGMTVQPTVFTGQIHIRIPFECMAADDPEQHITVYDICGRSIKTIDVPFIDHHADVRWDGYDDAGRVSTSGIYFITFISGAEMYTAKVVKIK
ncbi:VCBS repeat-containing protein [candidate division WOR-3 bacterium]|nr:VCBS repeat-containing protein [candidate division WOR-3 bacterium]